MRRPPFTRSGANERNYTSYVVTFYHLLQAHLSKGQTVHHSLLVKLITFILICCGNELDKFDYYLDDLIDFRHSNYSSFVILYADDVMLLARSVCEFQRMLIAFERELSWVDSP